jgi:hypothetical protein
MLVETEHTVCSFPDSREDKDDDLYNWYHWGPQVEAKITSDHSQKIFQALKNHTYCTYEKKTIL